MIDTIIQKMRYLIQRGRTYYFRWTIPNSFRKSFQNTEINISPKTHNETTALKKHCRIWI